MLASQNEFGSLPSSVIFWKGLSRIGVEQKSESEVVQSCPTLCDPMDCSLLRLWDFLGKNIGLGVDGSPPGSSVPGILQVRILEWVAISFSNA